MTLKPWHSFAGFGMAMLVGFSGVTCLSIGVIDRDRAERKAVERATLEENVRLSLWRMDSELAPLIANESTRPHLDWTQVSQRGFLERSPYVRMHFQFDEAGVLTSPNDTGEVAMLGGLITAAQLSSLLDRRREIAGREGLASQLALSASNPQSGNDKLGNFSAPVQSYKNAAEWGARARVARQARDINNYEGQQAGGLFDANALATPSEMAMLPLWIGDELVLVRRATIAGSACLQGAWIDWPKLRAKLLEDVRDLLPEATLVKVDDLTDLRRVLAAIPARIEASQPRQGDPSPSFEVISVLVMAWLGVAVAALSFGLLLVGAVQLSERRGAFVSAVTHELRTPLTTFRMYTEMLSEGMITDEAKKKRYLDTLRKEAIRLGHLVENVLSYARIERGRARAVPETLWVEEMLGRFEERLHDRASQADMTLTVELTPEQGALRVNVDASAVEQVLFNLVDNACKYAANAEDRSIEIHAEQRGNAVAITVSDHGPGIRGESRRTLFTAFSKSAHDAANSAPGVGLGLALSRRLARSMKGDLRYEDRADGARFVLTLPRG